MAIHAMKLSLPAAAVMKSLLHDVVEDTDVTSSDLAKKFESSVLDGVGELTKSPNQSREEFLEHVRTLRGETAVIKGLDRYDNLIRAFAIDDPKYHRRILGECAAVYDEIFHREPELQGFRPNYELLKEELRRFSAQP
jgi:GTP pyrophosphokinase